MQNETSSDTSNLESKVRDVVEQGQDVQEKVRQLTLSIIGTRSLDIKSLQQTADAVLRGARAGVEHKMQQTTEQTGSAREHLKQAVSGLEVALAQLAEAAKLAVEEAAGRAQKYSSDDLKRARDDLEKLEKMFLETLQSASSGARDAAGEILHDMAAHTRTHGSAIGAQLKETLSVIAHQIGAAGRAQVGVGLHLARNTTDMLRQIAAGVLTGMADHIKPGQSSGQSPGQHKDSGYSQDKAE
ncbi:MAG: hypothetical protein OEV15_06380 [Gallionella sp.]|nr:hypothetical protein [Gallionella sp.]